MNLEGAQALLKQKNPCARPCHGHDDQPFHSQSIGHQHTNQGTSRKHKVEGGKKKAAAKKAYRKGGK